MSQVSCRIALLLNAHLGLDNAFHSQGRNTDYQTLLEDCSYSVYIGENRVPGTLRTMENGEIVIDYIPAWQSIKSGDSVVTSGLDGIFFEDVQVGTIGSIKPENGYLHAELKPHRFSNRLSYVWLIDTKIPQTTNLNTNILKPEDND